MSLGSILTTVVGGALGGLLFLLILRASGRWSR